MNDENIFLAILSIAVTTEILFSIIERFLRLSKIDVLLNLVGKSFVNDGNNSQ
jgi:hypothetical protein